MHIFAYFFGGGSYFAYYFAYIVFRAYEKEGVHMKEGGLYYYAYGKSLSHILHINVSSTYHAYFAFTAYCAYSQYIAYSTYCLDSVI